MTRELKLALIVGFSLVLVVTVLISDHLSKARQVHLAEVSDQQPALVSAPVAEPSPAIPPPSEYRYAVRPTSEDSPGLAPAVHTEIVQSRTGGVFSRPATQPLPGDPDTQLIAQVQENGGNVVDRGPIRDIVLREPPSPAGSGAAPTSPLPPAPERTHTVIEGDSLCKIAKQYYGDENAWRKLAAANSGVTPESMKIGMKIKLPPSEQITGKPTPATSTLAINTHAQGGAPALLKTSKVNVVKPEPSKGKVDLKPEPAKNRYASYVVKKGDTVTDIARRHLGSSGRADELLRLNESVIEDEDSLQTGMVLRLPLS